MSVHNEGAVAMVGEWTPQPRKNAQEYDRARKKKKTLQAQPSEEMNGDIPLGYSGRTALRREQCDSMPETLVTTCKQQIATQRSKLFLQ
jgi:hypothetical protein